MINYKSNIFFGDGEVPIVDGEELKELLPNSHYIAIYEIDGKDRYTLRGKRNYGFFAVQRRGDNNGR